MHDDDLCILCGMEYAQPNSHICWKCELQGPKEIVERAKKEVKKHEKNNHPVHRNHPVGRDHTHRMATQKSPAKILQFPAGRTNRAR